MKFKVGDEVICSVFGKGTVISIEDHSQYPIVVKFIEGLVTDTYTEDGRMYSDENEDEGEHIRKLTKLDKALR